jgi:hypothetical protein
VVRTESATRASHPPVRQVKVMSDPPARRGEPHKRSAEPRRALLVEGATINVPDDLVPVILAAEPDVRRECLRLGLDATAETGVIVIDTHIALHAFFGGGLRIRRMRPEGAATADSPTRDAGRATP